MSRFPILFFACFSFLLPLLGQDISPPGKIKATSGYYIVTYKNSDVNLELSINGYPVKESGSNEDSSGQADVNYWIMPGKNQIALRISERKEVKKKNDFPSSPKANFAVVVGQQGQFPDDGEPFLSYQWPKEGTENPKASGEWLYFDFEPPFVPPTKLWTVAQKIEWSPSLEQSAFIYLEGFTKALNSKNPTKVTAFTLFRDKDTSEARYYPYDPAGDKKALQGMMKAIGSSWKLNKKSIKATLLCDGKIVNLTDKKGGHILTGKDGAAIPLYLSLIDGKWTIAR
jgi:hypothetical protein